MKIDVAIIGAGPAGMTAGIFAVRGGLSVCCFEQTAIGGNMTQAYEIDNYPGLDRISGVELADKIYSQAERIGVKFIYERVVSLRELKSTFKIKTNKNIYEADKVIIATGAKTRQLKLLDEKKFLGKGLSYCASCDGGFYKGTNVAVVGGGESALGNAIYLSKLASKVYLINRSEHFKFSNVGLNKLKQINNISIITNAVVDELIGEDILTGVKITQNGNKKTLSINGLFVAIGQEPDLDFVEFDISRDEYGYVTVDNTQMTSVKNVYACGDIVSKNFKQIITACGEGAKAGNSCLGG